MAKNQKKVFTDESLATFVGEIKAYTDGSVNNVAVRAAYIDEEDNENVTENTSGSNIIVDSSLSTVSTNPVQNKVVTNKINTISNEIKVERERINQLTSLGDGSTTGDAELIDARTDYTGKTWNNVGEHIRSVSTQLSQEIDDLVKNGYVTVNIPELEQGSISTSTGINKDDGATNKYRTVEYSTTNYCDKVVTDGMDVYVNYYNNVNGEYVLMSSKHITTESVINKDYEYMRFVFMTDPVSYITENDIRSAVKFISISTNTKKIENINKDIDSMARNIESTNGYVENITECIKNGEYVTRIDYEYGSIDGTTGLDVEKNGRYRNIGYISTDTVKKIAVNGDYVAFVFYYNYNADSDSYEFIRYVYFDPYSEKDVITNYTHFRIMIDKSDYSGIDYVEECENIILHALYDWKKTIDDLSEAYKVKDYVVKDYFSEHIESAVNRINENMYEVGRNGDTFLFITDIHWEQNAQNSVPLVKYVLDNTNVKFVINGGDLISQGERDPMLTNINNCMNAFKFIGADMRVLFGNHDKNRNNQKDESYFDRWFSDNEVYSIMQKRQETSVTYGEYFYFYFENPTTKTRFICLDTGEDGIISEEQFSWLEQLLNSDDFNVIIFAHWLYTPSTWNKPLEGGKWTNSAQTLFTKCDEYRDKVKAIMCGHLHCDMNTFTNGGIPVITTDTDSKGAYGEYTATVGTVSEQCFDVVTINYDTNVIKCVRVGRGVDRTFARE